LHEQPESRQAMPLRQRSQSRDHVNLFHSSTIIEMMARRQRRVGELSTLPAPGQLRAGSPR
jgi:hypothetical protein